MDTINTLTMYEYKGILKRIVDADTIDVEIDLGFRMTTEQRIRLKAINAPEIYRQKKDSDEYRRGKAAMDFVEKRFEENDGTFIIRTDKLPGVYGRFIGVILFSDSEKSLNDELIEQGHAVPY